MPPAVSVIVPARNAASTLERTLQSLRAQQLDRPFEVIVVDDGSDDETLAIAKRHEPFVRVLGSERSQGPGAARNRGASAASGPVLAFTDSDCFPSPDWLARALKRIGDADLVQGAVQPDPEASRTPFDRTLVVDSGDRFFQTANLLVRRDTFDAVGGFRDWVLERRSARDGPARGRTRATIGEDTLFAWSARRLGARTTFAEDAVVYHAVVPLGLAGEIADRWHWTRDMPGLVRLVPELRETMYRRWFFNFRTAYFDLAVAGLVAAALTRRRLWFAATGPYLRFLVRSARDWGGWSAAQFAVGAPASDLATATGLAVGSVTWRCLVL